MAGPPAVLGVVLLVVLSGRVAGAPFLQLGVAAARKGASLDPGPETLDVALNTTAIAESDECWGSIVTLLAAPAWS